MRRIDNLDELVRRLDPIIVRRIAEAAAGSVVAGSSGGGVALATFDDISGNLEWDRLDFTGSQLSDIASRDHGDLNGVTANQHHNQSHVLATANALGADHMVSGLTAGQVLQATGASAAKFASLSHGKLTDVTSDQHHPRLHNITSVNDHSVVAAQYGVVGATATDTLGIIASSNNPGGNVRLLRSTSGGALTLESFTSNGDIYGSNTAFRAIHHTHGGVDHVHMVINPGVSWSLDEQFGLDIDDNLLVRGWIVGKHALQIPDATMIVHFDGYEPFETNFLGDATGSKGQPPTYGGAPLFVAGKFDKCIQVSEAGQNLVTNPSFETGTTGWSTFNDAGGNLAASQDGTASVYGLNSAKLTATVINNSQFYSTFGTATSGQPYTASVWLKASVPMSVRLRLRQHSSPFTTWLVSTFSVTTEWQRYQITTTAPATVGGRISIEPVSAGSVWVDAAQVEELSYATHYMDGSLGPNCSWDGTANASSTTRTKTTLRYAANEAFSPVQGSVGMWFRVPYTAPNSDLRANCRLFEYGHYTSPVSATWIAMATDDDHSHLNFYYYNGSTGVNAAYSLFGANCCDYEWHHAMITWGGGYVTAYIDGAQVNQAAITVTETPSDQTYIGVGNNHLATENFPSVDIDDFIVVSRTLSADEVRAIYESNAPVFAESSSWHFRAGQNLLWADAEGLWMFNTDGEAVLGAYGGDGAGGTKTWGGRTLETSDVLIGDEGRGGFLHWDDSAASLLVSGAIEISEASGFSGSGYLQIGSGTKDSTLDGWNFAAGEIVGQLNGVDQVVLSAADGTVRAGDTVLRATGIDLEADNGPLVISSRAINWWPDVDNPSGNPVASVFNWVGGTRYSAVMEARGNVSIPDAAAVLQATRNAGDGGYFLVGADDESLYLDTNASFLLTASAPTLGSSWAHRSGDNLSARIFANMVNIVGIIDGSGTPSTTLCTVATAYRPSKRRLASAIRVRSGASTAVRVDIATDGTITAPDWTPQSGDAVLFELTYFL